MLAIVLVVATLAIPLIPAFVLGSIKAGCAPWSRTFWAS